MANVVSNPLGFNHILSKTHFKVTTDNHECSQYALFDNHGVLLSDKSKGKECHGCVTYGRYLDRFEEGVCYLWNFCPKSIGYLTHQQVMYFDEFLGKSKWSKFFNVHNAEDYVKLGVVVQFTNNIKLVREDCIPFHIMGAFCQMIRITQERQWVADNYCYLRENGVGVDLALALSNFLDKNMKDRCSWGHSPQPSDTETLRNFLNFNFEQFHSDGLGSSVSLNFNSKVGGYRGMDLIKFKKPAVNAVKKSTNPFAVGVMVADYTKMDFVKNLINEFGEQ